MLFSCAAVAGVATVQLAFPGGWGALGRRLYAVTTGQANGTLFSFHARKSWALTQPGTAGHEKAHPPLLGGMFGCILQFETLLGLSPTREHKKKNSKRD